KAGLDPALMAAANSSGGVLGKMISPQNLAIAAAAVGMSGKEGDIFRKVIGWSLGFLVLMMALVFLQSTPVLSWMLPARAKASTPSPRAQQRVEGRWPPRPGPNPLWRPRVRAIHRFVSVL